MRRALGCRCVSQGAGAVKSPWLNPTQIVLSSVLLLEQKGLLDPRGTGVKQ